ncbi:hypothetical protein [Cryptosporangium arvum]|uniref:Uncharacterized protein n=1 Tax=Cryptosporangium arvum DSM 44712 TaxID=927661 RepID=A0A011AIH7_9ACTN|nr:hypothetical protein [Cryptosporangium arvum]EXG81801.1 hypothetical protein CryarDRAFT_2921 [Cryptosporangium arvum DSM 44712]
MNELRTRDLLIRMANDPAPPTTVDVDRAIATAQLRRRRTQWLVIAAAAAVVLVVTLGVVTAFKPEDHAQPAPFVSAPSTFDPLNPRLEVGWVPDGFTSGLWNAAVTAEFRTYSGPKAAGVTVYAIPRTGGFPAVELFGRPIDGPDINGRPSTWHQVPVPIYTDPQVVASPGSSPSPTNTKAPTRALKNAGILRWEYGKGGTAQVEVANVTDPMEVATRIARSVRLDRPKPFSMPLRFSDPKIPIVRTAGGTGGVTMEFASAGWKRPSALIGVGEARKAANLPKPNVTLGTRKIREDLYPGLSAIIFDLAPGTEVSLQCGGPDDTEASTVATKAECRRLAASVQPVGTLSDPTTWTTSVLR